MKINENILAFLNGLKKLEGLTMTLQALCDSVRSFRKTYEESLGWYFSDTSYSFEDGKAHYDDERIDMIHSADEHDGRSIFEIFYVERNLYGGDWRDPNNTVTVEHVDINCYPRGYDPERNDALFRVWADGKEVTGMLLPADEAHARAKALSEKGSKNVYVTNIVNDKVTRF